MVLTIALLGVFLAAFSLWAVLKPADAFSEAERRTALDRVTRILRSLVLYYLPDPDAVDRALTR